MQPRISKNKIRREIRRQTEEYLARGGEIKQHEQGETGDPPENPHSRPVFIGGEPRKTRTYVNDVVSAIDERKKKKAEKPEPKKTPKPQKKIIYDDFGEPLREVWVDE